MREGERTKAEQLLYEFVEWTEHHGGLFKDMVYGGGLMDDEGYRSLHEEALALLGMDKEAVAIE